MEILIGIVIVLGGGYFWCAGGWYSRIVATVLFVPAFAFGGAGLMANTAPSELGHLPAIVGALCGGIAGWFFAAWPQWYWHHKSTQLARHYATPGQLRTIKG